MPYVSLPLEVGVFDPPIFAGAYLHLLPEARDGDEAPGKRLFQEIEFNRPLNYKDAVYDHRVCRAVHTQPGRVYWRYTFSFRHGAVTQFHPHRGLNLQRSGTPIVSGPGGLDFDYGCAHPVTTP